MRNLRGTIFYMKTNVLQDFHICISVPLIQLSEMHGVGTVKRIFEKFMKIRKIILISTLQHTF